MGRGSPDYHNPAYAAAAVLTDLATLVAFLFGCTPVDARGRVIWLDNFASGMQNWYGISSGGGSKPYASDERADVSSYCAYLQASSLSAAGSSALWRDWGTNKWQRAGIEFSYSLGSDLLSHDIRFWQYLNSVYRRARIVIDKSVHVLSIDTDAGLVPVLTMPAYSGYFNYVQMKLVVDFSTGKYVRFVYGNETYDLSEYNLVEGATAESDYIAFYLNVTDDLSGPRGSRVGYAVLTYDEP